MTDILVFVPCQSSSDQLFFSWNSNAALLMTLLKGNKHGVRTAVGVGGNGASIL